MNTTRIYQLTLVAAACALALAGCGGGGGSDTAAAPVATTTPTSVTPTIIPVTAPVITPTTVAADLQLTVPAATYGANTEEAKFFTAYNLFRQQLGLGLVAQNAKLDLAAKNHLSYVTTYSTANGGPVDMGAINTKYNRANFHIEDAARAGYTGDQEKDRAVAAMYIPAGQTGFVGEEGLYGTGKGAAYALESSIASVYHREGLMAQYMREIGLAVAADQVQTTVVEQAYATTGQRNASDYIGVYPADKQTGLGYSATPESPTIAPDLVTAADYATKTSYPISITSVAFSNLAVTSFIVTESGQATPLSARLFTASTNADTKFALGTNTAYIVGNAAFKPATTYKVAFVGTLNGAPLTRNWSFTTK